MYNLETSGFANIQATCQSGLMYSSDFFLIFYTVILYLTPSTHVVQMQF